MKLNELIDCDINLEIKGLSTNTRDLKPGDLFICIKGASADRHNYIPQAIEKGAVALITNRDVDVSVPYVKVDDPDRYLDQIYSRFYNHPESKLKIIGVTGTDGKTSTATIIQQLLGDERCGYIGTNGYYCKGFKGKTDNTTPAKEELYYIFDGFVKNGCEYVAMETSSEGFYYGRTDGLSFVTGLLTNIDSEHLNTHKTLENYIDCKKQLFRQTIGYSILNSNDKHFEDCIDACSKYLTYGYLTSDELQICNTILFPDHSVYTYGYKGKQYEIRTMLLGKFNAENLAAAILALLSNGFKMEDLAKRTSNIRIEGRMEALDLGQDFYCLVDYAHTPNGLRRLYEFTTTLDVERIITVIGQAGERDPYKRKEVGKIVADNSDLAIFTYEDPRNEAIENIMNDITVKIRDYNNYMIINDRHDAIAYAINNAKSKDLVLILGKGAENYQRLKECVIYFSDIEEATKAIKSRLVS